METNLAPDIEGISTENNLPGITASGGTRVSKIRPPTSNLIKECFKNIRTDTAGRKSRRSLTRLHAVADALCLKLITQNNDEALACTANSEFGACALAKRLFAMLELPDHLLTAELPLILDELEDECDAACGDAGNSDEGGELVAENDSLDAAIESALDGLAEEMESSEPEALLDNSYEAETASEPVSAEVATNEVLEPTADLETPEIEAAAPEIEAVIEEVSALEPEEFEVIEDAAPEAAAQEDDLEIVIDEATAELEPHPEEFEVVEDVVVGATQEEELEVVIDDSTPELESKEELEIEEFTPQEINEQDDGLEIIEDAVVEAESVQADESAESVVEIDEAPPAVEAIEQEEEAKTETDVEPEFEVMIEEVKMEEAQEDEQILSIESSQDIEPAQDYEFEPVVFNDVTLPDIVFESRDDIIASEPTPAQIIPVEVVAHNQEETFTRQETLPIDQTDKEETIEPRSLDEPAASTPTVIDITSLINNDREYGAT